MSRRARCKLLTAIAALVIGAHAAGCAASPIDVTARAGEHEATADAATVREGAGPKDEAQGKEGSPPPCPEGRSRTGDGCCWPGQTWSAEQSRCEGEPACPESFVASQGTCLSVTEEAMRLAARCAEATIPEAANGSERLPTLPVDCGRLRSLLPGAETELERSCADRKAWACGLLGVAQMRRKTVAFSVELHSRPCGRGKEDCYGHSRRVAQVPFGSGASDDSRAMPLLRRACEGGWPEGCMELGLLLTGQERVQAAEAFRSACLADRPAACAEAIYLVRATSRVSDPALERHAAKVMDASCKAGTAIGCSNAGFMVERGMVADRDVSQAPSLFADSCAKGEAIGCANLVFFAENHPKQARGLSFGDASSTTGAACSDRPSEPILCFAHALTLRRGRGVKAEPHKARQLLGALCKGGYEDACAVR